MPAVDFYNRGLRLLRDEDYDAALDALNRAIELDPALTWTGVKDTGRGSSLSYLGFHSVTRPKSYHLKKVTK